MALFIVPTARVWVTVFLSKSNGPERFSRYRSANLNALARTLVQSELKIRDKATINCLIKKALHFTEYV